MRSLATKILENFKEIVIASEITKMLSYFLEEELNLRSKIDWKGRNAKVTFYEDPMDVLGTFIISMDENHDFSIGMFRGPYAKVYEKKIRDFFEEIIDY